jgi:ribosomal protein S27AE
VSTGQTSLFDHAHTGKGCAVCADRIDDQINRPSLLIGDDFDAENGAGAADELRRLAEENAVAMGLPSCPFCGGELCAVTLADHGPGVSCGECGAYTSRLPWREPWLYEGSHRG